jgi:hypothetical protein
MRKATVTYSFRKNKSVPMIRLRGDWLRRAGFSEGMPIQVHVAGGKLTLTAGEESTAEFSETPAP